MFNHDHQLNVLIYLDKEFPELINILSSNFKNINYELLKDKKKLQESLHNFHPDLVIIEFTDLNDSEILNQVYPHVPVIVITNESNLQLFYNLIESGAYDCISKYQIDRLPISIQIALKKHKNISFYNFHFDLPKNLLMKIPDYFIITDLSGNIFYYNESFQKLFTDDNDLDKLNIFSIIHPEDEEKFRKAFQKGTTELVIIFVEIRLIIENKTIFTEIFGHIIHSENGLPEKVVLILKNITERKELEKELKENELLFRAVSENASFAVFIYQDNKFIYLNPEALKISGYTLEEFMKMNFWDIVHPDFKDLVKQRGLARLRGEQVENRYEFKILCKDGTERWLDFTATLINYKGKTAALGIAMDITERKTAETLLKKSHDFYIKLFNEFPTLLWRTDEKGNVVFFNKTWLDFRGRTLDQEIQRWAEDIHPEDKNFVLNDFILAFARKENFNMEYRLKNFKGEYRYVHIEGCPFFDPDGRFIGFIGSGYDITEKKDFEEKIQKLNRELMEKVKDLEKFKTVSIDRELKMIELKEKIKSLQEQLK